MYMPRIAQKTSDTIHQEDSCSLYTNVPWNLEIFKARVVFLCIQMGPGILKSATSPKLNVQRSGGTSRG